MPTALIYCRLSRAKKGATGKDTESIEAQRKACEKLARERKLTVLDVFMDNDISAYSGVERPGYRAMLERLGSGGIEFVIAREQSRLWRDDLEHLLFMAEFGPDLTGIVLVDEKQINPTDPEDRFIAGLNAIMNKRASRVTGQLTKGKQRALLAEGRWVGGSVPFGYRYSRDKKQLEIHADEATLVREAARRFLEGEGTSTIAADWRRRGITTTRGKKWTGPNLSTCLQSLTLSGRLEWSGEVHQGSHEAILSVEQQDAIRAIAEARKTGPRAKPLGKYALSGLLHCAHCGNVCHVGTMKGRTRYACRFCARLSMFSDLAEAEALEDVREFVATKKFAKALSEAQAELSEDVSEIATALSADRTLLTQLEDALGDGKLKLAQFERQAKRITDRIEIAERRLADSTHSTMIDPTKLVGEAWEHMTPVEQRQFFAALGPFTLHPADGHRRIRRREV